MITRQSTRWMDLAQFVQDEIRFCSRDFRPRRACCTEPRVAKFKGTVQPFYMWGPRNRLQPRNEVYFCVMRRGPNCSNDYDTA